MQKTVTGDEKMTIDKAYVDKYGMICTLSLDGGDSAFYMGHYYYLSGEPVTMPFLILVSHRTGLMRRHINESEWYGEWDRMSRDQSIPLLVSFFKAKRMCLVWRIFLSHLKRGLLFTTNTVRNGSTKENHGEYYKYDKKGKAVKRNYNWKLPDITGPNFWSIYIRGFNFWMGYPLLLVFDAFLLLGVISFNIKPREPNQLLILLAFSRERLPTPLSWLAWRVLNKVKVRTELRSYWFDKRSGVNWRPFFIGTMWFEYLNKET